MKRPWPVREAIESLPASAGPELPQNPEIRCALVRALDHSEGNYDAAMPSNLQSKHIRVGHKPRSADEHQCASFIAYPLALAAEASPIVNWTTLHFPPILMYGSGQRSYNFQHARVASWKSSGQTDLDGLTLLRPTKWSCLAEQVNLRADLQGERFEGDAGCLWLAQEGRINCRSLFGETDGDAFSGLASSSFPRMCAIDGVAIHLKPRTECKQTIHLDRRDGAVCFRAYIEQKVPILAHNVHQ